MEEPRPIDLTYVTERIITLCCSPDCAEETYLRSLQEMIGMLQSKHGRNYMLINVSQRNSSLSQMNHKVLDSGWADLVAPSLDQILSVCTAMENWLQADVKHVLVLHCRGGRGRLGVLIASYLHFSNMSASADLSLDHFAMRRFYNDKLSGLMSPSQKRYVWMLASVLKGGLTMCPSPSFLLCVALHSPPRTRADGGCCLFLRVYQSLQPVCTSAVYHVSAGQTDRLYFILQPAQLLKGDIMVVCYDKDSRSDRRQVVFRLQFHTGLVHQHSLTFLKADLDAASEDPRFPDDGKVELFLSESPEKIRGRELWLNGDSVAVDYDTLDPLVRRDSFTETCPPPAAPPHVLDGSVYASVRKTSGEEGLSFSPGCSERAPSASSDSGLSVASQGRTTARQRRGPVKDRSAQAGRLLSGLDFEVVQPLLEVMAELAACGGGVELARDESGLGHTLNGEASSSERETDILDDEDEAEEAAAPALEEPGSRSLCSLYSTRSWVQQQQRADVVGDNDLDMDAQRRLSRGRAERPPPLVVPDTPPRGTGSSQAVHRGPLDEGGAHNLTQHTGDTRNSQFAHTTQSSAHHQDDLASLTTDVDESIEQLNLLILDLDPTFVPVPNSCAPLSRSASLYTNGLSHKGNTHLSGWKQQQQLSDVTDYAAPRSPGWREGGPQTFRGSPACSPPFSPSRILHKTDSINYPGHASSPGPVPQTPAFPVSPPTPYVKHFSEVSGRRTSEQWEHHSWTQDARSFLESMNITGGSAEGDVFRSDASVAPASCQRIFGSMCSVSSGSPLPLADSATPPPVWHDRTPPQPSTPLALSTPNAHSSPRGPLRSPAGGVSVRRGTDSPDLSSMLLGNGDLEHSLLEAVEGLGDLSLGGLSLGGLSLGGLSLGGDGGHVPLLPEKRRWGERGDLGSRSPSLSGYSSPRSGSSISIPFSSSMTPDPLRGLSGASSPGADFGSKQDTVKFVQDTSRFWYKPDISRDQAITLLKDREPGSFVVRDSHSFRGAYGLAMKVATPPPSVLQQTGDLSNELVRHFLIECTQKGVRLKGCPNEPYFGSLTALVCQHSITPLALPCKLILPDKDPVEEQNDSPAQTATNSAAELLKQGAACNVWYLGSVALESLTGHQAVQKATTVTLAMDPPPASTVVHFKVSAQGITLTDNQRKLFFRRHYAVNTVIFCSLDPQDRKWTRGSASTAKIFGFVARKSQSETENMCHLFAEHDPEQPASAIVNFVSKVMIGSHKK
ncbi:si:ch211-191a24.3 isoform X2 [Platichthys flesus]|uniref:si:ch211-191a24.3 isoform X2 n=1 Tax=Platichthys flesus TaxID=8260 RepID=UPI002DBAB3E5|nr:si:ch211-191a24.3 isoform X2 [Platichthys flesus]